VGKRLRRGVLRALFDYQRFQADPVLKALIDETAERRLSSDAAFYALPDEAVNALCGAGGERGAALCPYCGAVLPDDEALRRHMAERHPAR
jgi:hypothetical protein